MSDAYDVPLLEVLDSVPLNGRAVWMVSTIESRNIPYGNICQQAAMRIRQLECELAEANAKMDETATNLVSALNRANSNGVQLDLIRDELKRIRARIIESKFSDDPYLSNIVDYCTRSQEDIATTYSVIAERDRLESQLTAHKAALEKCEKACTPLVKNNGGPICAEDTVDGQEYVMVKLQDFDGVVKALSEIAKLKPFDSVNSTQSSQ